MRHDQPHGTPTILIKNAPHEACGAYLFKRQETPRSRNSRNVPLAGAEAETGKPKAQQGHGCRLGDRCTCTGTHDDLNFRPGHQTVVIRSAQVDVVNVGGPETETTLRKALAIGADSAIRVNTEATDSFVVAKQLSKVVIDGNYDLVIAGRESIDYNGGMVPGMVASLTKMHFVNGCIGLEIDGDNATAIREIDGGKETVTTPLPLIIAGQKGLVEESDLRIPNMRGIMMARKKPLTVVEPIDAAVKTNSVKFEKPAPKGAVKLVSPDNLDELVDLLHNEAKVI